MLFLASVGQGQINHKNVTSFPSHSSLWYYFLCLHNITICMYTRFPSFDRRRRQIMSYVSNTWYWIVSPTVMLLPRSLVLRFLVIWRKRKVTQCVCTEPIIPPLQAFFGHNFLCINYLHTNERRAYTFTPQNRFIVNVLYCHGTKSRNANFEHFGKQTNKFWIEFSGKRTKNVFTLEQGVFVNKSQLKPSSLKSSEFNACDRNTQNRSQRQS